MAGAQGKFSAVDILEPQESDFPNTLFVLSKSGIARKSSATKQGNFCFSSFHSELLFHVAKTSCRYRSRE